MFMRKTDADIKISIHALVKRATCVFCILFSTTDYFNPRPREEGDKHPLVNQTFPLDFNPRPREEGDEVQEQIFCDTCISIHALVKRATGKVSVYLLPQRISIHALVKRATCAYVIIKVNGSYFNPRPREEGDLATYLFR